MATDQLSIEIFVDDRKAAAVLNKTEAHLTNLSVVGKKVGGDVQGGISQWAARSKTDVAGVSRSVGDLGSQIATIVTDIASGQNPMRVLAQEGGQLATAAQSAAASSQVIASALVSIGATLAVAAVVIFAAKKASEDILAAAQKRLKTELAITAEFNKQNILIGSLKKRLEGEANERSFNRFTQSNDIFGLNMGLDVRQRERDSIAQAIAAEQARRNAVLAQFPGLGAKYLAEAQTPEQAARLAELADEISKVTARIAAVKQESVQSSADFIKEVQGRQIDNLKEQGRLEKENAANRKKIVDDSIADAKRYADAVLAEQKRVAGLQKQIAQAQTNIFGEKLDNRLAAFDLRQDADTLRTGREPSFQQELQARLDLIQRGVAYQNPAGWDDEIEWARKRAFEAQVIRPEDRRAVDQAIIRATQGLTRDQLTPAQRDLAAAAREREAQRKETEATSSEKLIQDLHKLITDGGVKVTLSGGQTLDIAIKDDTSTGVSFGTSGNVRARHK